MENEIQQQNEQCLEMTEEELRKVEIRNAQVVRRQFFSHMKECIVTFRPNGIQFNTACISRFEGITHVMLLVDWEKKWFIIKPCDPDDKDAQRWCSTGDKGRKPRFITGAPFGDRMYGRMNWCKGKAYKVCGTLALQLDKEDELIMVFELNDAEEYALTSKSRKSAGVEDSELSAEDLAALIEFEKQKELERIEREKAKAEGRDTRRTKKKEHFPESWGDGLGVNYGQHQARIEFPHLPKNGLEAEQMGLSLFVNQGNYANDR